MKEGKEGDVAVLKKRNHVRVIDTLDEWEDLIGVVEEFMNSDGTTTDKFQVGQQVIVFFPLSREDIRLTKLVGVNTFTSFCRFELKQHEGLRAFAVKHLELVDPAEL